MTPWIPSLASVVAVSLVSLVGLATLSLSEERVTRVAVVLISFAVGTLLGDAFIHLIPDAFARPDAAPRSSFLVLAGVLLFFVVEKLVRHQHGVLHRQHHPEAVVRPLAVMNVVGDAVHNFIDGVLIGASYLVGPTLGISTTLAVLCHEVPQELGDFAILVHSGLKPRQAVLVNLASASVAILGTVVALLAERIAGAVVTAVLIPIAAGGFIYIAAADLIPELQHERSLSGLVVQTGLILLGVAVMALLALVDVHG